MGFNERKNGNKKIKYQKKKKKRVLTKQKTNHEGVFQYPQKKG